jgi:hypothetical protein
MKYQYLKGKVEEQSELKCDDIRISLQDDGIVLSRTEKCFSACSN